MGVFTGGSGSGSAEETAQEWTSEILQSEAWQGYVDRFSATYWTALPTTSHLQHALLIGPGSAPNAARKTGTEQDQIIMSAQSSEMRAATEFAFYTQDHPGLFARMAGAFALVGASVVDAHAFTTKDGMAVNSFWVQDDDGGPYSDP